MSFIRGFEMLLEKTNNSISQITLEEGITLCNYNNFHKLERSKQLFDGKYTFLDCWFDIDSVDNIYGVLNDKEGSIYYVFITDNIITKSRVIKYKWDMYTIDFPYIKRFQNKTSLIYYVLDRRTPYKATLVNFYNKDGIWYKYEIDEINYEILTDFNVIYDKDKLEVFYLNIVDGATEVFMSSFNLEEEHWSAPRQITATRNPKVYLSVIKDEENSFHITFSESIKSRYNCRYVKAVVEEEKVVIKNSIIISETIACTFPSILKYSNNIYIIWNEYNSLFSSISNSNGQNFSKPSIVKSSINDDCIRCNFKTNSKDHIKDRFNNLYLNTDTINIIKFIYDIQTR